MSHRPIVSVVLIFLDAKPFLAEAIESVLAQTCRSWELLMVNDGSTDGSREIAQRYAEQYGDRIFLLEHPGGVNRGKSTSRNLGIRVSKGPFVAFLDADDVWLPGKLTSQLALLEHNADAVMVYGPTRYWFSWAGSDSPHSDVETTVGVAPGTVFQPPDLLVRFLSDSSTVPGICSLLVRRDAVVAVGGFEESIQHMFEDQTLIAKICLYGHVVADTGCWDMYRQHDASSSAQAEKAGDYHPWRPNPARILYLKWLSDYVEKTGQSTEAIRESIRRELWLQNHRVVGTVVGAFRMGIEAVRRRLRL